MDLKRTNALIFATLSTMVNIILGNIANRLIVPGLQLTSLGTIFTAVVYGPWFGGLTGLITSIIQGVNKDVKILPLALTYISIGIIVGFMGRKMRFTYYNSLLIGLTVGVVSAIILTLTNPYIYINLISMISNNVVDKVVSSLIVSFIMNILANRFFKEEK